MSLGTKAIKKSLENLKNFEELPGTPNNSEELQGPTNEESKN